MARGNPVNGWHRQTDSMVIAKTPLRQIRGNHHHAAVSGAATHGATSVLPPKPAVGE